MNNLFKLKIIFAYYVTESFTSLHKWHLIMLNNMLIDEKEYYNDINIYLLVDDINNNELIELTKTNILSYINNYFYVNFHIVQNNNTYREGLIYKTEIIDKLDQYDKDTLILFLHTKGVSNKVNINYYENTLHWISIMYYFNFYNVNMIFEKFFNEDIITYGALYNYDDSSLVKYKWQYTGSFHWIYPYRLLSYFKVKNINYKDIKHKYNSNTYIRHCAESFIGDNIETTYAGFLDDHLFNKTCSHFLYENSELPYHNILYISSDLLSIDHHDDYLKYFNKIYNNFKNEITDDI